MPIPREVDVWKPPQESGYTRGFYDANDVWVPGSNIDTGVSYPSAPPLATDVYSAPPSTMEEEVARATASAPAVEPYAPPPPAPPSDNGGEVDLSGGGTPSNAWQETYTLQNAPSWWRGMTALEQNSETEYISMMNNMLPFLSPEDQRTVASSLYQMLPEYFGSYDPNTWEKTTPAEYEIDPETGEPKLDENGKPIVKKPEQKDLNPWARAEQPVPTLLMQEYQTTKAAEQQMAALQNMARSMGISDPNTMMGPGFRYLQQIAGAMKSFGAAPNPEEGWTRARKEQYMNTIDPLLASTSGTNNPLAAYSTLAKMMTQPYFSNAEQQLMPTTDANGNIVWESNPQWWR